MQGRLKRPLVGLLLIGLAAFAWRVETRWLGWEVVVAALIIIYCALRLLSFGPLLSAYASVALMLAIFKVSRLKFLLTARRLHPFDIYVYGSWRNLFYIQDLYPHHYIYVYLAMLAFVSLALGILHFEGFMRAGRRHFVVFALILAWFVSFNTLYRKDEQGGLGGGNAFMHFNQQHLSTFFISAIKAFPELLTGRYFDYGENKPTNPLSLAAMKQETCVLPDNQQPPNVVAVLRESIMVPASLSVLGIPDISDERFAWDDGKTRHLRVETHGAGSAHAILSLLSGISSTAFGGNKSLDLDLARSNLHYSLARKMQSCGYRTIAVSSGSDGYVASRDFYQALGFEEVYELGEVAAANAGDTTDRAIYKFVGSKFNDGAIGERPVFVYMDTTASHAPYDQPIRPDDRVAEVSGIQDPAIAEYVRRLILGERDLSGFLEQQKKNIDTGGRPLVILDFGDHQPYFTKSLPGFPGYVNEDPDQDDPLLLTYFRIKSAGYKLAFAALPQDDKIVDVPFLSDWLLRSLGWKVEGVYALRWQMVEKCRSRYWQCDHHAAAQELHRSLRDAGLISYQ
jgi:hypothetical protein